MHFMLKCLFISYGQCFIKAVNVTCGNLFSNQWVVTVLETEVFKYNFLNLTQKPYSIFCWYLYSWHFLVPRARGTASGLMLITFLSFTLSWQPCTTAVPLFAGFTCWDVLGSRRPRLDRLSQDDDPRCMSSATTGLSLLHSVDRFLPVSGRVTNASTGSSRLGLKGPITFAQFSSRHLFIRYSRGGYLIFLFWTRVWVPQALHRVPGASFDVVFTQWCIAKNRSGYTQRGVAKGLKVPCLFMITEVSIRCQNNPEVGIRRIPPNTPLCVRSWAPISSHVVGTC